MWYEMEGNMAKNIITIVKDIFRINNMYQDLYVCKLSTGKRVIEYHKT